jgi:hypothetical protein
MPGKADPDRAAALQNWQETFGSPPPPYLSVAFMWKALAHEAQCRRHGRLPAPTRNALRKIAEGRPASDCICQAASAGSHLVREWNGRTYQVEVLEKGFRMDGKDWPSLSAIAKHITGTAWSGPRFFGLTGRGGTS